MPSNVTATSSSRPTEIISPDTRFAAAPLAYKYRDYSVPGEELQDKATGEIFIRRPADGKIVSYFQNKRYLYEQANELNIVLSSNTDYVYNRTKEGSMYAFVDYDITTITKEERQNILTTNLIFGEGRYGIDFKLSVDTNKFICRLTTRDSDKAIIEYLTSLYDRVCKNYVGPDSTLNAEASFYTIYPMWDMSNALITYTVTATDGVETKEYTHTEGVRLNDATCLDIGKNQIDADFISGCTGISVKLESVEYRKPRFVIDHLSYFGDVDELTRELTAMCYSGDGLAAYVHNCGIALFADSMEDVNTNPENGTLVCVTETTFMLKYLSKMRSISTNSAVLLRVTEPDAEDWLVGVVWAEFAREISKGGATQVNPTVNTFEDLEEYYAPDATMYVSLSSDPSDEDAIYVEVVD